MILVQYREFERKSPSLYMVHKYPHFLFISWKLFTIEFLVYSVSW